VLETLLRRADGLDREALSTEDVAHPRRSLDVAYDQNVACHDSLLSDDADGSVTIECARDVREEKRDGSRS
jgi:hypothetical protein